MGYKKFLFILFKILSLLILLSWEFIFIGLFLEGFSGVLNFLFVVDLIFNSALVVFSLVLFSLGVKFIMNLYNLSFEKFVAKVRKKKDLLSFSLLLFLLMFFYEDQFGSLLLYAGYNIGSYFILLSRNAFKGLLDFDIYKLNVSLLAWLLQWYLIYYVLSLVLKLFKKLKKKII